MVRETQRHVCTRPTHGLPLPPGSVLRTRPRNFAKLAPLATPKPTQGSGKYLVAPASKRPASAAASTQKPKVSNFQTQMRERRVAGLIGWSADWPLVRRKGREVNLPVYIHTYSEGFVAVEGFSRRVQGTG